MWASAVLGAIDRLRAMSLIEWPRASSRSTWTSRGVRPATCSVRRPTGIPAASSTPRSASASTLPALTSARISLAARSGSMAGRYGRGSVMAW
jgi:hypothetical protein